MDLVNQARVLQIGRFFRAPLIPQAQGLYLDGQTSIQTSNGLGEPVTGWANQYQTNGAGMGSESKKRGVLLGSL